MLSLFHFLPFLALLSSVVADPNMAELEGTWSSKSNTVFTGPGFYDPVDELLIEPALPGISYSFTADGYYEEAMYRVKSNPQNHSCPVASITYQHGKYQLLANGSLVLTPLAVDGRQLLSDPCGISFTHAQYQRYIQPTWFKTYQVMVSPYYGRMMLQIYQFDGSPMQPLYLAYKPPMMLPTHALNPTDKASETSTSLSKRMKRSLENQYRTSAIKDFSNPFYDMVWWGAVVLLGCGSAAYVIR